MRTKPSWEGQLLACVLGVAGCLAMFSTSAWGLGELLQVFEHEAGMKTAVFSPDGNWVASGAVDGPAKVWSPSSGAQRYLISGGDNRTVAFSYDGTRAATATGGGGADLWDMTTGAYVKRLGSYNAFGMSASPSAPKLLVYSILDHKLIVYDTSDGTVAYTFPGGYSDSPYLGVYSPDGTKILTGKDVSREYTVGSVWDAETYAELQTFNSTGSIARCVAFSPDGALALLTGEDASVALFNVDTGELVRTMTGNTRTVYSVRFSPDGTKLATWGYGEGPGGIPVGTIWNATTGASLREFNRAAEFSPDGRYLVIGDDDTAQLLDASTLTAVHTFSEVTTGLGCAVFSPDGQRVVLGCGDKILRVFYVGDGPPPIYCSDLLNDAEFGEGPLLVAGMPNLAPAVQDYFNTLGWHDWGDVDMEKFDLLVESEPVTVGDGLPDRYQVALVQYALDNPGVPDHDRIVQEFEENRTLLRSDADWLQQNAVGDFMALKSYDELFAAMLGISAEMQAAVNAFVKVSTDGTTGLPHIADYHVFGLEGGGKTADEPYSAMGDLDGDGLTNVDEYEIVVAAGGGPNVFASVAFDPYNIWYGNSAVPALGIVGLVVVSGMLTLLSLRLIRRRKT